MGTTSCGASSYGLPPPPPHHITSHHILRVRGAILDSNPLVVRSWCRFPARQWFVGIVCGLLLMLSWSSDHSGFTSPGSFDLIYPSQLNCGYRSTSADPDAAGYRVVERSRGTSLHRNCSLQWPGHMAGNVDAVSPRFSWALLTLCDFPARPAQEPCFRYGFWT